MLSLPDMSTDHVGRVRHFVIAVLATLLLLIATSCGASEPRVVEVPVEKEIIKEVEVPVEVVVEKEVVREVPVQVEVVKEVPVEKVVEVV